MYVVPCAEDHKMKKILFKETYEDKNNHQYFECSINGPYDESLKPAIREAINSCMPLHTTTTIADFRHTIHSLFASAVPVIPLKIVDLISGCLHKSGDASQMKFLSIVLSAQGDRTIKNH